MSAIDNLKPKSIYVIGPTASGKSDLAITLAHSFNGEVISCDSRQIYRGMDIGSGKEPGKITRSKKRGCATRNAYISSGIPHYLIDTHHPNTIFSADKFVTRAHRIKKEIIQRKKLPIIAGGTLFWAQGLLEGSVGASVPPNDVLRRKLQKKSTEGLFALLTKKDPDRAESLIKRNEINNKIRIIRSLEIIAAHGKVPEPPKPDYTSLNKNNLILAITPPQEVLYDRIERRLDRRLDDGMLQEVHNLHFDMGVSWTRLENFGLEYRWCTRYLRGQITESEMHEKLRYDIKHYAKRQLTWIKRWEKQGAHIHRIQDEKEALTLAREFLTQ